MIRKALSSERAEEIIIASLTAYQWDGGMDPDAEEVVVDMVSVLNLYQMISLFGATIGFLSATLERLALYMDLEPDELLRQLAILIKTEPVDGE